MISPTFWWAGLRGLELRTSSVSGKQMASSTISYLVPELALSSVNVHRRMPAAVAVVTQLDTQPFRLLLVRQRAWQLARLTCVTNGDDQCRCLTGVVPR
jgi:hypothetical protein